eukprot:TRINITY_DN15424_c0_g1_i2.p4 TRINITY_DN15424_c0_g1~~TRINITY_DN15424_c0_g1_i2.p4  ORF type:complete len:123 (-),score=0.89 TRINITY_DN15424_c0_g1_i2:123-491(-)
MLIGYHIHVGRISNACQQGIQGMSVRQLMHVSRLSSACQQDIQCMLVGQLYQSVCLSALEYWFTLTVNGIVYSLMMVEQQGLELLLTYRVVADKATAIPQRISEELRVLQEGMGIRGQRYDF